MPELPEVETLRRDLEQELVGRRIDAVEVTGLRSIRRHQAVEDFAGRLRGRQVGGVGRRGKYVLVSLDNGDVLVIHLGMSGQVLQAGSDRDRPRHTHVVLVLAGGTELRFVDPRTFGELFVTRPDRLEEKLPELAHLGLDPLDDRMRWTRFADLLHARRAKLKPLLMDQRFVVGIGNIYADEILFAARLRHDRISATLTSPEVRRLHRAIPEILENAIAQRGSSLADQQYRDLFGATGRYQGRHQVYDREGKPCSRCGTAIERVQAAGRSTYFCPSCQVHREARELASPGPAPVPGRR